MTSKKAILSPAEIIKKFAVVINSSETFIKLNDLEKIIKGSLKDCREKLSILETEEGVTVLSKIEPSYQKQLILNVEELFYEDVEKSKCILKDIDCILSELQIILESICQRLEEEVLKSVEPKSSPSVVLCYEDCRSILTFLKLKTHILRSHVLIPFDENADSNPFVNCPKLSIDEENYKYLLSKLEAINI